MNGADEEPGRPLRWARDALVIALIIWGLFEIVARVASKPTGPHFVPSIAGHALLPYQVDEEAMRGFLDAWTADKFTAPDAELGWVLAPSTMGPYGSTNPQGVRAVTAEHVYADRPAADVTRVLTFGDSFTFGDEVTSSETWQAQLERSNPRVEAINFGVGGYGTDQAYLRARRVGRSMNAQVSVLGIWVENVCRNLNVFRFYLAPNSAFIQKPRFVLEEGALRLVASPSLDREGLLQTAIGHGPPELLALDEWYDAEATTDRPWHLSRAVRAAQTIVDMYQRKRRRERLYAGEDPRGIAVTVAIAQQFARDTEEAGMRPLVVVFPMDAYLERLHSEDGQLPLTRALRAAKLEVVDTGPAIARAARAEGKDALFMPLGHLSPRGNALVADAVGQWLTPLIAARGATSTAAVP